MTPITAAFLILLCTLSPIIPSEPSVKYPDSHAALIIDGIKLCSGVLVTTCHILTTASCAHEAAEISVILGTDWLLKMRIPGNAWISATFQIHPDFTLGESPMNDVALITLPHVVHFGVVNMAEYEAAAEAPHSVVAWKPNGERFSEIVSTRDDKENSDFFRNEMVEESNIGSPTFDREGFLVGLVVELGNLTKQMKIYQFKDWIVENTQ